MPEQVRRPQNRGAGRALRAVVPLMVMAASLRVAAGFAPPLPVAPRLSALSQHTAGAVAGGFIDNALRGERRLRQGRPTLVGLRMDAEDSPKGQELVLVRGGSETASVGANRRRLGAPPDQNQFLPLWAVFSIHPQPDKGRSSLPQPPFPSQRIVYETACHRSRRVLRQRTETWRNWQGRSEPRSDTQRRRHHHQRNHSTERPPGAPVLWATDLFRHRASSPIADGRVGETRGTWRGPGPVIALQPLPYY
mmetsp:Transcript_36290/g.86228  ORF Transcript_36290/g.86228 Transcript_36290/m.86228 type:complete len:250 (-) Transcript_36290:105-854(-)